MLDNIININSFFGVYQQKREFAGKFSDLEIILAKGSSKQHKR